MRYAEQTSVRNVPAFPSIWGLQDRVAHHKRRYRMRQLLEKIEPESFTIERAYHFNFLLFVPIWTVRRIIQLLNLKLSSEGEINSPLLNAILSSVFAADLVMAPVMRPPFGVSILVMARKSDDS